MISLKVQIPAGYGLVYGRVAQRKLFRQAGNEVAAAARTLIRKSVGGGRAYRGSGGGGSWRPYQPGAYTASAAGAPPVSVTGWLARSIKVKPFKSGEGVAVRDTAFTSLILETGAKGGGGGKGLRNKRGRLGKPTGSRVLLPRPFLTLALQSREGSLPARIRAAVVDDIAFQRVK